MDLNHSAFNLHQGNRLVPGQFYDQVPLGYPPQHSQVQHSQPQYASLRQQIVPHGQILGALAADGASGSSTLHNGDADGPALNERGNHVITIVENGIARVMPKSYKKNRCRHPSGCKKWAQGGVKGRFCNEHGGGKKCSTPDCDKWALTRGLCRRHGGGKRCAGEGCPKGAEGKSEYCLSHGGGKKCTVEGCTKSGRGPKWLCTKHGGGRRCQAEGCPKSAVRATMYCVAHGGGKKCAFEDDSGRCSKSAAGATDYCISHGGGRRCQFEGCSRAASSPTDFCIRHGGGKRCSVEGCNSSAPGKQGLCKKHGGGYTKKGEKKELPEEDSKLAEEKKHRKEAEKALKQEQRRVRQLEKQLEAKSKKLELFTTGDNKSLLQQLYRSRQKIEDLSVEAKCQRERADALEAALGALEQQIGVTRPPLPGVGLPQSATETVTSAAPRRKKTRHAPVVVAELQFPLAILEAPSLNATQAHALVPTEQVEQQEGQGPATDAHIQKVQEPMQVQLNGVMTGSGHSHVVRHTQHRLAGALQVQGLAESTRTQDLVQVL